MDKTNRIQRRRHYALMDLKDFIPDISRIRDNGPLGPVALSRLQRQLDCADRALSRLRGAPPLAAWPEDRPPDRAEAMRRLLTARYALIDLLRPRRGPMTGRKRNHEAKEIPAHYAPRESYPRAF